MKIVGFTFDRDADGNLVLTPGPEAHFDPSDPEHRVIEGNRYGSSMSQWPAPEWDELWAKAVAALG